MSPNWLLSVKLDPFGTDLKFYYYYYFYYDYDDDDYFSELISGGCSLLYG